MTDRKVRVIILEIPTTQIDLSKFDNKLAERVMQKELTPTQLQQELHMTHATFYRYRIT